MSATWTPAAICPECGRRIATLVPKGGDGSGSVYRRHLAHVGGSVQCAGGRLTVRRDAQAEASEHAGG